MPDRMVYLTPESARRIANAVKTVERLPRVTVGRGAIARIQPSNYFALVTSTIGAGNLSATPPALGKGEVTLYSIQVDSSGNGTLKAIPGMTGVTAYHGGSASIAPGRYVQVKWCSGALVVDVDYC